MPGFILVYDRQDSYTPKGLTVRYSGVAFYDLTATPVRNSLNQRLVVTPAAALLPQIASLLTPSEQTALDTGFLAFEAIIRELRSGETTNQLIQRVIQEFPVLQTAFVARETLRLATYGVRINVGG